MINEDFANCVPDFIMQVTTPNASFIKKAQQSRVSSITRIGNSQFFFRAKNAYSFDDYIVLHVTLASIATALQAAAVPLYCSSFGKTLT